MIKYGRQNPVLAKNLLIRFWTAATPRLTQPPFFIDDNIRPIIATVFKQVVQRLDIKIPACAIMNDHVHVLILRSKYRIEYLVNQLKGSATRALRLKQTPWARACWKVFITDIEALLAAANYIQANSTCAGMPNQSWDFITPLPV